MLNLKITWLCSCCLAIATLNSAAFGSPSSPPALDSRMEETAPEAFPQDSQHLLEHVRLHSEDILQVNSEPMLLVQMRYYRPFRARRQPLAPRYRSRSHYRYYSPGAYVVPRRMPYPPGYFGNRGFRGGLYGGGLNIGPLNVWW